MKHHERLVYLVQQAGLKKASQDELQELMLMLSNDETGAVTAQIDALMTPLNAGKNAPADDNNLWDEIADNVLKTDKHIVLSMPRRTHWMQWAAAAIVVLTLGAGTWFFINKKDTVKIAQTKQSVILKNDLAPGSNRATLTLANGTAILLDSAAVGQLTEQNNTMIFKKEDGQVEYRVAGKDNKEGEAISYNTMTTPKGGQYQLTLADGTKVWLNAASSLRYPTAFSGNERKVDVTGEAYFEVTADASRPFKVAVNNGGEIEVLGTRFNVNAYTDEESIRTTLIQGAVKVHAGTQAKLLAPGQQAQLTGGREMQLVNGVNIAQVIAWKNGSFNFQDRSLKEVMRQLARWYDLEVIYEKGIPNIEFFGEMGTNLNLSQVLTVLEGAGVKFRVEENRRLVVMPS